MQVSSTYENPLNELQSLLWDESKQCWHARARKCNVFVSNSDPEEAIILAIKQRDEGASK